MKWIIQREHDGMLVREYLREIKQFSRRILIAAKSEQGYILVNGKKQTVRYLLKQGDVLEVGLPPEKKGDDLKAEQLPLHIVYEDDDILLLNKQAGIATMPSLNDRYGTVANGILGYYEKQDIPHTVHIVTRLDRDTTGLLLVAKHRYSHSLLSAAQIAGDINRTYKAIVHGHIKGKSGMIRAPIGREPGSIIKRTVIDTGQEATTAYQVEQNLLEDTVVKVRLLTGRTHQIRVHFSYLGHPLVGDTLYGGTANQLKRQALHCEKLSFIHPFTKEELTFYAQLPQDMHHYIIEQTDN